MTLRTAMPTRPVRPTVIAAVSTLLAAALTGSVLSPSPAAATNKPVPAPAVAEKRITYRGYEFAVPRAWPVIRLDENPLTCVRFDRPAVYLGTPGPDQDCPSNRIGGADALLVQPTKAGMTPAADGAKEIDLPQRSLRLTFAPGTNTAVRERILGSGRTDGKAAIRRTVDPEDGLPAATSDKRVRAVHPGYFTGEGFDTCTAPSQHAMDAWRRYSPYRAIGVYLGGASRACSQPNLTAGWVRRQHANGWHLLPLYVGLQAPCTTFRNRMSTNPSQARLQGRYAARDAIIQARNLGISVRSAIYADIEAYNRNNAACKNAVLYFLDGWTARLHESNYRSGAYGSVSSLVKDLVGNYNSRAHIRPDHLWFAWWNKRHDVDAVRYLPRTMWRRARIHQYSGNVRQRYGGVTINVDGNLVDVK